MIERSIKRRVVFGAIATLTAQQSAVAETDLGGQVEVALEALKRALARLHGRPWTATVNHESGFMLLLADERRDKPSG
jgi:hypothetical protein